LAPVMDTELTTDIPIDVVERPEVDGDGGLPTPTAGAMIVFDAVRKIYEPNVAALTDVSFVIEKGDFVFVVGASGSGKSTVIRLVLKEIEPTAGKIVVGGRDLTRLKRSKVPYLRRNIGCVFQDFKLLPDRSAAENVAYALKVQGEGGSSIRRKVPEVLNLVGLAHKMSSLLDRARRGQPPAAFDLRRADRESRSRYLGRDHAVALPDQPRRHDGRDGDARP